MLNSARARTRFWIGGGEQHADDASGSGAEQGRSLGSDGVQHGSQVVHPLLGSGRLVDRHGIGRAHASWVEQDQATERREPVQEALRPRLSPPDLEVIDPVGQEHQVERTVADDLVRDVQIVGARVLGLGKHDHRSVASPARQGSRQRDSGRHTHTSSVTHECAPPIPHSSWLACGGGDSRLHRGATCAQDGLCVHRRTAAGSPPCSSWTSWVPHT